MRFGVVILCVLGGCFPIGSGDDWAPAICGDGVVAYREGETCDDGNTVDGDGCDRYCGLGPAMSVTWSLKRFDGTVDGCPAESWIEAHVYGETFFLPCADGGGTQRAPHYTATAPAPNLAVIDRASDRAYYATHVSMGTPLAVDFLVYTDAGYGHVTWQDPTGCTIVATSTATSRSWMWEPDCALGELRFTLPLGDYTVTVGALPTPLTLHLATPNEVVNL